MQFVRICDVSFQDLLTLVWYSFGAIWVEKIYFLIFDESFQSILT